MRFPCRRRKRKTAGRRGFLLWSGSWLVGFCGCGAHDGVVRGRCAAAVAEWGFRIGVADRVAGHLFVGAEVVSLQELVRLAYGHEHVGVHFMPVHVPEEFLASEYRSFLVADDHPAPQFPKFLVVAICRVGLDEPVDMEGGVELFQQDAFDERPARRVGRVVDVPFLGCDFVAYHAGVGNQRVDIEGRKRRHVFGVAETVDNGFFLFFAGGEHRPQYHDREYEGGGELRNADGVSLEANDHNRYLVECNEPIYYTVNEVTEADFADENYGRVVLNARDEKDHVQSSNLLTIWIDREVKDVMLDYSNAIFNSTNDSQELTIGTNVNLDFIFTSDPIRSLDPISRESDGKMVELYFVGTQNNLESDYVLIDRDSINKEEVFSKYNYPIRYNEAANTYSFMSDIDGTYLFRIAVFPTFQAREDYLNSAYAGTDSNSERVNKMVNTLLTIRVAWARISSTTWRHCSTRRRPTVRRR